MAFKCVVIDDEPYAAAALAKYVESMPDLKLVKAYTDPLLALSEIGTEQEIDFIFLDIEMPFISGLELAKNLRNKTKHLIFVTSHDQHALKAFELKASHYLLKPVTLPKFALVINDLLRAAPPQKQKPQLKLVKAGQKNSYHYLDFNDIISIKAQKNYITIITAKENFTTHLGLNQIEAELSDTEFIRVNRSCIIAKKEIKKIEGNLVKLKNGEVEQVGETYKPGFLEWIQNNLLSFD